MDVVEDVEVELVVEVEDVDVVVIEPQQIPNAI